MIDFISILISEGMGKKFKIQHDGKVFGCEIKRIPRMLHLCGYVTLPRGHRLDGVAYENCSRADGGPIEVHGGLTYSGSSENDDSWVIGFDCAHAGDLLPLHRLRGLAHVAPSDTYRDMDYVERELEHLVRQL